MTCKETKRQQLMLQFWLFASGAPSAHRGGSGQKHVGEMFHFHHQRSAGHTDRHDRYDNHKHSPVLTAQYDIMHVTQFTMTPYN